MKYETLISTLNEIINNENIYKPGLKLVYELEVHDHIELERHIFSLRNTNETFKSGTTFEIQIDGIKIELTKKK